MKLHKDIFVAQEGPLKVQGTQTNPYASTGRVEVS